MVEKADVIKALKEVIDPETGVDIVRMGLVKRVEIKGGVVRISFSPTVPFCPLVNYLREVIEEKVRKVKGVEEVKVEVE